MDWPTASAKVEGRRFPRVERAVVWLRERPTLVLVLTGLGIAVSFVLDLLIPGYAIAGFYLIPLMLVAFTLRERSVIVVVAALSLSLTVFTMVIQGRAGAQNILLVWFGALAGAGLIALGYLYNRFDQLYAAEHSTTARLQLLATQLQKLQEVSVLDTERPLADLLRQIVLEAQLLLGSDAGALFRHDAAGNAVSREAAVGLAPAVLEERISLVGDDAIGRALRARHAVATGEPAEERGGDGPPALMPGCSVAEFRACLAVPLAAGRDLFGVIALYYREPRAFSSEDAGLAQSFADQAALAIENTRLREQVQRSAVTAERTRLARDLHDSVTQSLFAASLKAETLLRTWEPDSAEARQSLDDVRRLTRGALAEMRTLLLEMRPAALAQSSLGDLLRHLVEAIEARTRIPIKVTVVASRTLPPDVTIALYRIAQEALNNAINHAHARRVWVTLDCSSASVRLEVGDNGRGFDTSTPPAGQLGLKIMRERAEAVAADLSIDSEIKRGTVVRAAWTEKMADSWKMSSARRRG
jgi:signal transduction histidine kinase